MLRLIQVVRVFPYVLYFKIKFRFLSKSSHIGQYENDEAMLMCSTGLIFYSLPAFRTIQINVAIIPRAAGLFYVPAFRTITNNVTM